MRGRGSENPLYGQFKSRGITPQVTILNVPKKVQFSSQYVLISSDSWEGLYKDGQFEASAPYLYCSEGMDVLDLGFYSAEVDQDWWDDRKDRFPERLADVKMEWDDIPKEFERDLVVIQAPDREALYDKGKLQIEDEELGVRHLFDYLGLHLEEARAQEKFFEQFEDKRAPMTLNVTEEEVEII